MKYLSVNAFAKICGVTKHTLYHYEDVGLFRPVYVSEKGYRYYSYRQYDQIRFILTLRALDIPIEEIKAYMRIPHEDMEAFLGENIEKIDAKIHKMQQMKNNMETLLERSREMSGICPGKVFIENIPEMKIMGSKILQKAADYEQGMEAYAQFCCEHQVEAGRAIGERIQLEKIKSGRYFEYDYVFIDAGDTKSYNDIIEGGRYLCLYYSGSYEECYKGYQLLMTEAQLQGIQLAPYGYEIYVTNNILIQDEKAQITKIFIKIE